MVVPGKLWLFVCVIHVGSYASSAPPYGCQGFAVRLTTTFPRANKPNRKNTLPEHTVSQSTTL